MRNFEFLFLICFQFFEDLLYHELQSGTKAYCDAMLSGLSVQLILTSPLTLPTMNTLDVEHSISIVSRVSGNLTSATRRCILVGCGRGYYLLAFGSLDAACTNAIEIISHFQATGSAA